MKPTHAFLILTALTLALTGCTTDNNVDAGRKPADRPDLLNNQPGYVSPAPIGSGINNNNGVTVPTP